MKNESEMMFLKYANGTNNFKNMFNVFECAINKRVLDMKPITGEFLLHPHHTDPGWTEENKDKTFTLPILNLGPGKKVIAGTIGIGLPEWNADSDPLPYDDESVGGIHAYHFLEHVKDPLKVLKECERVLYPGGVMNILVPYYTSQLQAQDLDHKSQFSENTWRVAFQNEYYNRPGEGVWAFKIGFNMIMGLVEKDLCLVTQLIKAQIAYGKVI